MTRWEFRIVPVAGGNASATCLKMLVMRFADVQGLRDLYLWVCFCILWRNINFLLLLLILNITYNDIPLCFIFRHLQQNCATVWIYYIYMYYIHSSTWNDWVIRGNRGMCERLNIHIVGLKCILYDPISQSSITKITHSFASPNFDDSHSLGHFNSMLHFT